MQLKRFYRIKIKIRIHIKIDFFVHVQLIQMEPELMTYRLQYYDLFNNSVHNYSNTYCVLYFYCIFNK